jgi:non-ribosomal peptide synthetase component E (peptide arylation enzyme)
MKRIVCFIILICAVPGLLCACGAGKDPGGTSAPAEEMKVRENIVPGEIVSALCEEDCIADARVFGVPDDFYGERVVAAIVLSDPENYKRSRVYKNLAAKLAEFKLPDKFIVFEAFPTLPNGKVDGVKRTADLIEKCKK